MLREKIKEKQKEKKISQTQMAKRSGMGGTQLKGFLTGTYNLTSVNIESVFKVLNLTVCDGWTKCCDELPEKRRPVIAFGVDEYEHKKILRAIFVPDLSISTDDMDFDGPAEYDENGNEFWPKGWYEWNETEEIHYKIQFPITHWKHFCDFPE